MDIPNYQPNSRKYTTEKTTKKTDEKKEKKVEKVVTGNVKVKDKSNNPFVSEDARNVGHYVVFDILVPAAKKAIVDMVTEGISMILGEPKRSKNSTNASYVSYRSYSDRDHGSSYRSSYDDRRDSRLREDIILESRGEAEEVLSRMDDLLDTYGYVSVADLYDLIGKSCAYTDGNYGWTTLRSADVIRVRDGYLLKLPRKVPLR